MKQRLLLKNEPKEYGGTLLKTRKGRSRPRPLDTKNTMHLVLRSSHAKAGWSFRVGDNPKKVSSILKKFAKKYGVQLLAVANVGNHIHIHMKLGNRFGYKPFIRAVTAAIAMAITGVSRWKKIDLKFWDLRPYTRVVVGREAWIRLTKYVRVNQLEGMGYSREVAKIVIGYPGMEKLSSA